MVLLQLNQEEIRTINVIKAVMDLKSIDKSISFIINDYSKTHDYKKFIKEKWLSAGLIPKRTKQYLKNIKSWESLISYFLAMEKKWLV